MQNNWDYQMQEDFDNMTTELGRECLVYARDDVLTSEGQEGSSSGLDTGVPETVFLQELDSEHEMVAAGELSVGDVTMTFLAASTAEEEGYVSPDGTTMYKILKISKVRNQSNNVITYIKAFGKKVPNR
jgi:hypothetical protein